MPEREEQLSKPATRAVGEDAAMTVSDHRPDPPTAAESMLSLDGGTIHVYEDGDRDARTLLLIHGTAASGRSWEPMVPLLTGSHHVVRIDLLGCGLSGKPDGASYAVSDQARRAGEAMDRLRIEHAVVIGHSSGGAVATALAEARADLVSALALLDTGPNMAALTAKQVPVRTGSWNELTDDQVREAVRDAFQADFEIPKSFLDQFRGIDLQVFAAISAALRAYLNERSLPERLAPLGKPLLVIFGEEDARWRPSSAAEYLTVPGARVELLPGVGHSPNIEDPSNTAAQLLAFASARATR
jgi:pimeloyl-ACP methyl ester carboxylesterase